MVKGVLEPDPQLQQSTLFKEAKIIEQWSKTRGREISQDKILGEGDYAAIKKQAVYDDHTLDLCHSATLNGWDRTVEIEEKIESFTKVIQGPMEAFMDFLQRLTSAVNRMILNSEARQIMIKISSF